MNGLRPLDYVNKAIQYGVKWDRFLGGYVWDYYTSIHPKSESQYQTQMFLRGVSPWYDSWMVSRSTDERNRNLRGMYGINFSDVTYPHLSGVMSENTTKMVGSASWQFSKNLANLYK